MDIFSHTRAYVLADAAIRAKVSQRFYPLKVPQGGTYPAITLQRITGIRMTPLKGRASVARPRYQFDVWTREAAGYAAFSECQEIGRLLLDRLEGKNTVVQDGSPAESRRIWFEFDTDEDLFESDVNGGFYRYRADFFIWHQTGNGVGS